MTQRSVGNLAVQTCVRQAVGHVTYAVESLAAANRYAEGASAGEG